MRDIEGKILVEGKTFDIRHLIPGSVTWQTPIPVIRYYYDAGHAYSKVIGKIDEIWRKDNGIYVKGAVEANKIDEGKYEAFSSGDSLKTYEDKDTLYIQGMRLRAVEIGVFGRPVDSDLSLSVSKDKVYVAPEIADLTPNPVQRVIIDGAVKYIDQFQLFKQGRGAGKTTTKAMIAQALLNDDYPLYKVVPVDRNEDG